MRSGRRLRSDPGVVEETRLLSVPLASTAVTAFTAAATTTAASTTPEAAAPAAPTTPTTAIAAAATTATPTKAAATTAATTRRPFFARAGFIDGKRAAAVLVTIECGDRRRRLVIRGHLDESKTLASSGFPIVDDLGRRDLAMLAEQLLKL
jgi:hypothetical protein